MNAPHETIISLDISTNSTGYSIWDKDKLILLKYDVITMDSKKLVTFQDKMYFIKKEIETICKDNNVTKAYVEEYAKAFGMNKSNANAIIKLAAFNEFVCFVLIKEAGVKELSKKAPSSVRKDAFGNGKLSKDEVFEHIMKNANIYKPSINKTTQKPFAKEKDIADSIAVFLSYNKGASY